MRKISERTLNVMLMEMRKLDRDRERILHPSTLENLVNKYKLPIAPCLPRLKDKFEDKNYPGFTNYEQVVRLGNLLSEYNICVIMATGRYLGERRQEGQKDKEDKMPEVTKTTAAAKQVESNSEKERKPTRKVSTYSPPKHTHQRSRYNLNM